MSGAGSVDYQSRYTVCLRRPDVCRITFSILLWSRVLEFVHRGAALQVFSSHLFVGVVLIPFLCFCHTNPFFVWFCFNKTSLLLDLSKTHTLDTCAHKITEGFQKKKGSWSWWWVCFFLFLFFLFFFPPTNINCHFKAAWDVRLLASGSSYTHCFIHNPVLHGSVTRVRTWNLFCLHKTVAPLLFSRTLWC